MSVPPSPPASPKASAYPENHQPLQFERPPHVFNRGTSPPFTLLTALFKDLGKAKPPKRRDALSKWFHKWRTDVGNDLYPAMRLLVPQCDKDRAVYGLKEQAMAKIYITVLELDPKSNTATRLRNWKKPNFTESGTGDFPSVLYDCIKSRVTAETTLTIDEVNSLLDDLSASTKVQAQAAVMSRIAERCSAEDQIWIARIILKDLKIATKENTVFSVFHPSAFEIYNSTSDLKQVCWKLYDLHCTANNEDTEIQLFHPFQPMLCKRPRRELQDVVKLMGRKEFIIEEKLDGERIQLHKRGKEYYFCSRKGKDYTYLYGQHVGTGSLTPFIDHAFDDRVKNVILDGEMLVWDPVTEHYLPFGWLKPAALNKSDDPTKMHPCFKVFDILMLNDQRIYRWPLHKRKDALRKVFQPVPNVLEYAYETRGRTAKDVKTELERVMDDRGEGLVVKNPDKPYVLAGREDAWLKVKPEYVDEMSETVDVLVVGADYGTGKRGGGVSTLICAVRDDTMSGNDPQQVIFSVNEHADDRARSFLSFVRIGSGLSMSDFEEIRQKNWREYTPGEELDFVKLADRGTEDKPDVYIRPEDSFVITVKAAEIVTSEKYAMDWTMRFPRCRAIRRDATWEDVMTVKEIHDMRTGGRKREASSDPSRNKRRKVNQQLVLPASSMGTNVKNIQVKNDLFDGLRFVILEGMENHDKSMLEKLVHEGGGKFQQLLKGDDLIVISSRLGFPKANAAVKKGFDILTPRYIVDCVDQEEVLPRQNYLTAEQSETEADHDERATDEMEIKKDEDEDHKRLSEVQEHPEDAGSDTEISDYQEPEDHDIDEPTDDEDYSARPPLDEAVVGGVSKVQISAPQPSQEVNPRLVKDEHIIEDATGTKAQTSQEAMDEDEPAEDDTEKIFSHLVFYLDSPANAQNNALTSPETVKSSIVAKFDSLRPLILEYGGKITDDIHDTRITHIIVDKRDKTRISELRSITQTGNKYRQQVTADFVTDSIDDGALVSESVYRP
ncbi:ATP-dependent DNA ligase [Dacryopinax primogenitus]|uniref:DNA ligase n=1 Tax=Dacryopinax primogenitus (strain DJM 731) TaxID=1858805 RepID=M5GET9_DACPD|nr:ATP-dependent DNA ligase [Dacryopinax primogenitus]EJU03583.1 ATP-dependent DNA ligase [Dacryopinax primogenitus]